MIEAEIDSRISFALGFVRRMLPSVVYRRELDDLRQIASVHALASDATRKSVALATWAEIRRHGRAARRLILRENWDAVTADPPIRHEPIADELLRLCSDRERAAIRLFYEADMPIESISEFTQSTNKATGLLLVRGRNKVRRAIDLDRSL
jgi:DNA-directed RNA polymerase specialized sigma24 family protein